MLTEQRDMVDTAMRLKGVSKQNRPEVLSAITEGRYMYTSPDGVPYGWCGDFVTYLAALHGSMNTEALNRVSVRGSWLPGQNLTLLSSWANRTGAAYHDGRVSRVGDFIIIPRVQGNHIAIIIGRTAKTVLLMNGNGMMGAVSQSERGVDEPVVEYIMTDGLFMASKGLSAATHPGQIIVPENPHWYDPKECCK